MTKRILPQATSGEPVIPADGKITMQVLRRLGSGGMGDVFLCELDGKRVAVKRLKRSQLKGVADPGRVIERFRREAMAGMRVRHPCLVPVYKLVEQDGEIFMIMEYVPGKTLQQIMRERIPFEYALRWATDVCEGLVALHGANIVHRDVKPGNVIIDEASQRARLIDYGIARVLDAKTLTTSPMMLGTPLYMSPEQASQERVDLQADLFSFGTMLYELISGKNPFVAGTIEGTALNILFTKPKPLRELAPEVPAAFGDLVERLMEKGASSRPATAKDVLRELFAIRFANLHFDVGKPGDMDKRVISRPFKTIIR